MKILITGGLGFIGSNLIKKLKSTDCEIYVIDNMSSSVINLDDKILNNIKVLKENIKDVDIDKLPDFDIIFHLASPIGPISLLQKSGKIAYDILNDTQYIINLSQKKKSLLVFFSSCEIYGNHNELEISENAEKKLEGNFNTRNEYSVAKLLSEIIISNTSNIDSNFKYQIIRPFNIVGSNQGSSGGHIIPRLVTQALSGKEMTVYLDGKQKRSFIDVTDAVNAIILISKSKKYINNIWNIGNNNNVHSILYIANLIKKITNSKSEIVFVDPKDLHGKLFEDSPTKIPNNNKIKEFLLWEPKKNIHDILNGVLEHYENR